MSIKPSHYLLLLLCVMSSMISADIPNGYRVIQCTMKPIPSRAKTFLRPYLPGPKPIGKKRTNNQTTSTNWGGFVGVSNLSNPARNSVNYVAGSWIVPTVTRTSNAYSAYWVGIDGYTSPTVEQIGTAHDMINGEQQHYAWFEMYPRSSYEIVGFPVNPGDVISGSVTYVRNGIFRLTLLNNTRNVAFTVPTSYTKLLAAKRSSAEWIVEAPFLGSILPLSNFGTAYLWGCRATINGVSAQIGNNTWPYSSITMVTNSDIAKATPSTLLPDGGSFFMQWAHS